MTKKWGQFHWKSVLESNKYYSWNQCYWLIQSQPENGTSLSSVGPNPCQSDNIPPCWMAFLITLTSSEIKTKKCIRILQKNTYKDDTYIHDNRLKISTTVMHKNDSYLMHLFHLPVTGNIQQTKCKKKKDKTLHSKYHKGWTSCVVCDAT